MRLLHAVATYAPGFRYGGPVASVRGLAEAQVRQGHEVWVATTDWDDGERVDAPPHERLGGVEVVRFGVLGPPRLRYAPGLAHWLQGNVAGFDRVHAHGMFVSTTTMALAAARRRGVPSVLAPRGMLMGDALALRGALRKRLWLAGPERRNLAQLGSLHLTAARELELLADHIAPRAARLVVPNGVAAPRPALPADCPDAARALLERDEPFALFLGRLHPKKGLDRLLRAWADARPAGVSLAIAGPDDGARSDLLRLAEQLGVSSGLVWLGPVRAGARDALLARARALLYPSRTENFGNSALEAMACGCPVYLTPEVGARDAVLELCGGEVAPIEAWASHLPRWLAADLGPLERGALAARTMGHFGWDAIAERLEGELALAAA